MTAETFTAASSNSRLYPYFSRGCGTRTLDATAVAALAALNTNAGPSTATTINEVLDILEANEIRGRAVGTDSIGLAQHVDA